MKNIIIIVIIAAAGYYFILGGNQCSTQEDLKEKIMETMEKIKELAASGDMSKIIAVSANVKKLNVLKDLKDIPAACQAMDDLMDEM